MTTRRKSPDDHCGTCKQRILSQYETFDKALSKEDISFWNNSSQTFFKYSQNDVVKAMGKRMKNLVEFYPISISMVALEGRKIVEGITYYYQIRKSENSTFSSLRFIKKTLKQRIDSLEGSVDRNILNVLHKIRIDSNKYAHSIDIIKELGAQSSEVEKRNFVGDLVILLRIFDRELKDNKDMRCNFHYYHFTGCNKQNCRFTH